MFIVAATTEHFSAFSQSHVPWFIQLLSFKDNFGQSCFIEI